jgi:predicted nucleic acid-binding protein
LIVLDASAALDYLVDGAGRGEWVREVIEHEAEVAAPHLIDIEVLSGLRKSLAIKQVTRRQAEAAIADFGDLALTRYPATQLLDRIWELRAMLTAYDAAYVSLTEVLGGALVTTDNRLGRSHGHRAKLVFYPG